MRIAARYADAWHGFGSVDELARKSQDLTRQAERAGREPAAILRATSLSISEPWDEVRATAEGLAKAGIGYVVVSYPSEGRPRLEEFAEHALPDVAPL